MTAACPFEECDGSGFVLDLDENTARPCRCRPQRVARARARSLSAVIPRRYRDASFERPPVIDMPVPLVRAVRSFVDDVDARLDAGDGLWFMGEVGTGKTTLAMLVSKAALAAGRSVAIYSMPKLISLIRRTYDDDSTVSDVELIERLAAVDLLHIDDLGAERTSDWVLEQVYSIVNARWEDQRSMVVTTNITDREALCAQIGERTVSRLTEMCQEIPVFGPDRRLELRA